MQCYAKQGRKGGTKGNTAMKAGLSCKKGQIQLKKIHSKCTRGSKYPLSAKYGNTGCRVFKWRV